jgi:hypothetical protein
MRRVADAAGRGCSRVNKPGNSIPHVQMVVKWDEFGDEMRVKEMKTLDFYVRAADQVDWSGAA